MVLVYDCQFDHCSFTFVEFVDENVDALQGKIVPFVACGDLSGYDADKTYMLEDGYKWKDPLQPPTIPPYKSAIERKRKQDI